MFRIVQPFGHISLTKGHRDLKFSDSGCSKVRNRVIQKLSPLSQTVWGAAEKTTWDGNPQVLMIKVYFFNEETESVFTDNYSDEFP